MYSIMCLSGSVTLPLFAATVLEYILNTADRIAKPVGIIKNVYHKNEPVLADRLKFTLRERA